MAFVIMSLKKHQDMSALGAPAARSTAGAASTRATCRRKNVVEHKARAHRTIDKINLDTPQEIERNSIHVDVKPIRLEDTIVVGAPIRKGHSVGHATTATPADKNADGLQIVLGIGEELSHFFLGRGGQSYIVRAQHGREF
jgi:hypothetical protein